MYGEPLKPKRTAFTIEDDDNESGFAVYLTDLDDPSNDGVRDVDHPEFEVKFGNMAENLFEPSSSKMTKAEARAWLLSIGMTEIEEDDDEEDEFVFMDDDDDDL